jgi:hypothetical protein
VASGWQLADVVNDPLGVPGSTPLYLCLPPAWGSAGGDWLFPTSRGTAMNVSRTKTGRQDLKLERGPFFKGSLQEIVQQGAGRSGTSVRCPDSTMEPASKILVEGREEPMVLDQPETPTIINRPAGGGTDVPLQGTSLTSVPAGRGSGQQPAGETIEELWWTQLLRVQVPRRRGMLHPLPPDQIKLTSGP